MNVALAAAVFAPGLAIGSFLNVVAARLPLKRSVVRPRSACMQCAQELRWYDNVPLVSYAMLRGRCRHCGVRIALVYPAVEFGARWLPRGVVVVLLVVVGLSAIGFVSYRIVNDVTSATDRIQQAAGRAVRHRLLRRSHRAVPAAAASGGRTRCERIRVPTRGT